MLKTGCTNGSNTAIPAVLRHRSTRYLATWLTLFIAAGSLWYYYVSVRTSTEVPVPSQSSVYIHKSEAEIDVLPWPEERWFEAPRNGSQLEKAALVMLVRYTSS
jgi:hypothetical protein